MAAPPGPEQTVHIPLDEVSLEADVALPPPGARAVVLFAHGSGSSRRSGRNRHASTGAAALITAADRPDTVVGVICRGGRPDLAGDALSRVQAPTLLVVGGADTTVLELNESAARQLPGDVETAVVPGATHLFEEPGALDAVVDHAINALDRWLTA